MALQSALILHQSIQVALLPDAQLNPGLLIVKRIHQKEAAPQRWRRLAVLKKAADPLKLGSPTTSSRSNETRLADPRKYAPRKQLSKLTENSCSQGKSSASVNEKPHKGAAKSCLIFSAKRTNPTSSWDCVDCKLVYTESDDNWVQCIYFV